MKIGRKITLYFTIVTITLIGIFFIFIYTLIAEFRQGEFQKRLRDNTMTTLRFLAEVQKKDRNLLQSIDRFTINNLYQEKVLLFDENKNLIYSGIDDTEIIYSKQILDQLSEKKPTIGSMEGEYDVVGTYLLFKNVKYYGIVKAYDIFGHSKMEYLRNVLVISFFLLSLIIVITTVNLSRQISLPLNQMAREISNIKLDSGSSTISIPDTKDEINFLGQQFNILMSNLKEAFAFQKHAIHHISHELKTPIAILVSNFEKMEKEQDMAKLKTLLRMQKEDTHNLSNIINALLEISKAESGNVIGMQETIRIDDMLYDLIEEIRGIRPAFDFEVTVDQSIYDESRLTVSGNKRLLSSAFTNLLMNCINYSHTGNAQVHLASDEHNVQIIFRNTGALINDQERQFIFQHFFRGTNSRGVRGFGLGLVLIRKIMDLHHGGIEYSNDGDDINVFTITLPLSASHAGVSAA